MTKNQFIILLSVVATNSIIEESDQKEAAERYGRYLDEIVPIIMKRLDGYEEKYGLSMTAGTIEDHGSPISKALSSIPGFFAQLPSLIRLFASKRN